MELQPVTTDSTFSNNSVNFTTKVSYLITPHRSCSSNMLFNSVITVIAIFISGFSFITTEMMPQMSISAVDWGAKATILASACIQYDRVYLLVFCCIPVITSGIIPFSTAKFTAFDPHIWDSMNEVVLTSSC